jgi:transitional endoplasmic reticulum ATPase
VTEPDESPGRVDVVEHRGGRVRVVDPAAVLRSRGRPLVVDGPWPRPVTEVELVVDAADGDAGRDRVVLRGRVVHGGITLVQALRTGVRVGGVSVPLAALPLVAIPGVGPLLFGAAVAGTTKADLDETARARTRTATRPGDAPSGKDADADAETANGTDAGTATGADGDPGRTATDTGAGLRVDMPPRAPKPASVRDPRTGEDVALTHVDGTGGVVTSAFAVEAPVGDPDAVGHATRLLVEVAALVSRAPDGDAFLAGRTFVLDPAAAADDPDRADGRPTGGTGSPGKAAGKAAGRGRGRDGGDRRPTSGLDALGGLDDVVAQLRDIATSFRHPEAMAAWGARRPQGILLYGPPGTGKTTLAKALAVEAGAELMEVRTPDLIDKWVGASERNLRKVFTNARKATVPTVLFFDEFESIIGYTGAPRDAASQMHNALAGLFKQEMNTLAEDNPRVMVVATTNFRGRIDDSIVRAGRFDVKVEVPMPDAAGRADILRTILRRVVAEHEGPGRRIVGDDIDVVRLADLTAGATGADLDALVRRVQWAKAMQQARTGAAPSPISHDDLAEAATRPD